MAMLEINHLQKKFGTTEVLRDVSLSVSKGDVVAILGPIFGALADTKGFKKPLFILFMMLGVLGCAAIAAPLRLLF